MNAHESQLRELRQALSSGRANVARVSVPAGRALSLVDAEIGSAGVFWEEGAPSAGPPTTFVGLDTASHLKESGTERFHAMVEAQARVFSELRAEPALVGQLRFFGGSAFTTGRDGSGCWEDFGDSTFVLPRVLYIDRPEGAELLAIDPASAPGGTEHTLAVVAQALAALDAPGGAPVPPAQVESRRESAGEREFEELVALAQERIRAGRVDKVALARRETLTLSVAPRVGVLLERLRKTAQGATRFAFRIGERTFVGATPECLVKRQDLLVETEALAGTAAKSDSEARAALLASAKDQDEHRYVVEALKSALGPLCRRLDVAPEAVIKELPQLLHLCTPIKGQLERPLHVLELVMRLHPTPAVCGSPTAEALRFIVEHEAAPRGWYAAPFGWADARGNGHFVVGLRSALLHGKNVHLYAGAGIVRGSKPKLEYEETELKLQSIRSALGLGIGIPSSAPPA